MPSSSPAQVAEAAGPTACGSRRRTSDRFAVRDSCFRFAGRALAAARCWWLLLATCLISFALFAARINEGFIGADDGTLAHAAERVLHGEQPQVDFYDNYTGALSYGNAVGLKLFGMRMQSLRWMLFVFFVAVGAGDLVSGFAICFAAGGIADHLAGRACGARPFILRPLPPGTTCTLPPSGRWRCFAISKTGGLFGYFWRALRREFRFLFKIAGLYFLAAMVLFLVFDEQSAELRRKAKAGRDGHTSLLIALALCGFDCLLWGLIRSRASAASFYNFLLPVLALSALLHGASLAVSPRSRLAAAAPVGYSDSGFDFGLPRASRALSSAVSSRARAGPLVLRSPGDSHGTIAGHVLSRDPSGSSHLLCARWLSCFC